MLTASKSDTLSGLAAAIPAAVPADYLAIFLTREETLNLEEVLAERKARVQLEVCGTCGGPVQVGAPHYCPGPERLETDTEPIEVGQAWYADIQGGTRVIEVVGPVLPSEFKAFGSTVAVRELGTTAVWDMPTEDFGKVYKRLPFRREES